MIILTIVAVPTVGIVAPVPRGFEIYFNECRPIYDLSVKLPILE